MTALGRAVYTLECVVLDDVAAHVGAFSVLDATPEAPISFGTGVRIGHHAVIRGGARFGDGAVVDDYCLVAENAVVGADSQVLYGAKVFEDVHIGDRCLIGGSVANWTRIGHDVTFMGLVAHTYRQPEAITAWNTAPVPSPVINDRAVVGEAALLIGGITIGEGAYVAAGEVVRCDIPAESLYLRGRIIPLERFKGFIKARP